MEYVNVPGKDVGKVTIFTLSTCGWCRKTKDFLKEKNIAYSYVDVDLLSEEETEKAERIMERYNPDLSFPTIVIEGKKPIIGYNLSKLLDLAGEE